MNLIHIADTHLGLAAFNRLDPESGMNLSEKINRANPIRINLPNV